MGKATLQAAWARRALDRRLRKVRPVQGDLAMPPRGWIRAIREALGMTATQLAARLGVSQATVSTLEQSEARGSIQLSSLRRAAEAMNCTLVYAFVPNQALEEIVQERARAVAADHLRPIEQTMLLEDQGLSQEDRREQLDAYIRTQLDPRLLWDKV